MTLGYLLLGKLAVIREREDRTFFGVSYPIYGPRYIPAKKELPRKIFSVLDLTLGQ